MFKITFGFLNKTYTAKVQKINQYPIQFIVFDINPYITYIPDRLVYRSNPDDDQLIYQSFDVKHKDLLIVIGQTIFTTCSQQKINVHN